MRREVRSQNSIKLLGVLLLFVGAFLAFAGLSGGPLPGVPDRNLAVVGMGVVLTLFGLFFVAHTRMPDLWPRLTFGLAGAIFVFVGLFATFAVGVAEGSLEALVGGVLAVVIGLLFIWVSNIAHE